MGRIENVCVVGAGTMGAGIAQVAASHGCRVKLIDVARDVVDRGYAGISRFLEKSVAKGKIDGGARDAILERISTGTDITGLNHVQLAVEAVVENVEVKRSVFRALEEATSDEAVFATNTSSLSVAKIASALRRPERMVGMHFFNPAPLMPLVEIIATESSSADALATATAAAASWGKTAVRAKDTPGFIVNRVARGFYLEALRMLGEGVADVVTIDEAMRSLGRFRMGPFELMDLVGLDVNYAVSCSVWERSGRPERLEPHEIQKRLVEEGRLGRKSGRGFYRYDGESPVADVSAEVRSFEPSGPLAEAVDLFVRGTAMCAPEELAESTLVDRYVFSRVLTAVMNEAALTLNDEVASREHIDIAMQRGTNYPKGPLEWAKGVGEPVVATLLDRLCESTASSRFSAAPLFQRSSQNA